MPPSLVRSVDPLLSVRHCSPAARVCTALLEHSVVRHYFWPA